MEIGILTSSRADFGFYKPLIRALESESDVNVGLIAFGTHLSDGHGYTIKEIRESGFRIFKEIHTHMHGNAPEDIVKVIGDVHVQFADFWRKNRFDLIICLGDRYEMFAAVSATVPFNLPVVHISGGEQTLGAIDDIYRNTLTLIAKYHFTNTQKNAIRVKEIIGADLNVHHTGSLAVDNIKETKILSRELFLSKFEFDISQNFILFTFHPETINFEKNVIHASVLKEVLLEIELPILVTMPNADTMGETIREVLLEVNEISDRIHVVESLGSAGYYTALSHSCLVLGNSSSGIVEAASFAKYVINLGERQSGRECGTNIVHCSVDKKEILEKINAVSLLPELSNYNIYGDGCSAQKIVKVLMADREKIN